MAAILPFLHSTQNILTKFTYFAILRYCKFFNCKLTGVRVCATQKVVQHVALLFTFIDEDKAQSRGDGLVL